MRAGAQALVLLAAPLNAAILRVLEEGPKRQPELRRAAGSPAETTLRAQLKRLVELGGVEKRRPSKFPGALEYELVPPGRNLLTVTAVLERWLGAAPDGPLALGEGSARAAIKALAEGWSTGMLRALAAQPMSLTKLDRIIASHSYPSLERRLSAMRFAGLIEPQPGHGRGTPYAATDWLRRGVAPLIAATRWERRWLEGRSPPLGPLDVEATLLLAVPLVTLPAEHTGACRLGVEIPSSRRRLSGVVVDVRNGKVGTCSTKLSEAEAWALGPLPAWLSAVSDHDIRGIELGGNYALARGLVEGLHACLFRVDQGSVKDCS